MRVTIVDWVTSHSLLWQKRTFSIVEAEYAAENRIKFIPCLMEKSFRAQSWLGIIKGSNYHIDFSSPENFDESLDELVRQITHVEKKLSMQPRKYFLYHFL